MVSGRDLDRGMEQYLLLREDDAGSSIAPLGAFCAARRKYEECKYAVSVTQAAGILRSLSRRLSRNEERELCCHQQRCRVVAENLLR